VKQDAWGANVYTVPFAGGPERPVTSDSGSRQLVQWLPGTQRISDLVLGGSAANGIEQEVTDLVTGLRRTVRTPPGTVVVRWLSDGTAVTEEIGGQALGLVDSGGRSLRRYPLADSLGTLDAMALSPDGAELAVATHRPGVARVVALRLADGSLRHVADLAVASGVHVLMRLWGGDGFLYFSRVVGLATPELWRIPARGGVLQRAAALPVACSEGTIALSRDARAGACLVTDSRPDLWLVERR